MKGSLLLGVVAFAICGAADAAPAAKPPTAGEVVMARMALDQALAPVHGRAQFEAWSARHPSIDENPFLALSAGSRHRFLEALDAGDVAQGAVPDPADLENELTLAQAVRLLAVVGAQTFGVLHMPDIRIESDADKVADAWRRAVETALEGDE
jgi:hypothetical protein